MVTVPASAGDAASLVGREREVGELRLLTAGRRLVTLCGAGGIGKTSLLRALMAAIRPDYPDGAFLVLLRDLRQPELVLAQVARALRIAQEPGIPLADTLTAALAGRRLLLALDGVEHVAAACAQLCARLMAGAPGVQIVAAGREPLRVPGETIWQVPPLLLPGPGTSDPGTAIRSDAAALFALRAAAAAPGFVLDQGTCAAVTDICRSVGGVPLAVELAAARLRDQDVTRLARQLAALPGLPGPGEHAVPVPHAAMMRSVVGWSHDALSPAEQAVLRRLAVSGGWTLEMAEQVCADEQLPAIQVGSLLTALAGWSLVSMPGPDRFRLPGAVLDDAAARLAQSGEGDVLHRRLRDYAVKRTEYLKSITTARVPVTEPVLRELYLSYGADARNIRTVLAWCREHGDVEGGLRICTEFTIPWLATDSLAEGRWWLDQFLAAAGPDVPATAVGPARATRAEVALSSGDLPGGRSCAAAGLEQCRAAGNEFYSLISLNVLAQVALATADPETALRRTGEVIAVAEPARDWWNLVYALNTRAPALAIVGRMPEARECGEACLALTTRTGQYWGSALARMILADLAWADGDLAAAREYGLAALQFTRLAMPPRETARCLARLGRVAMAQGEPGPARGYLAESLQLSLATGSRAWFTEGLLACADLAAAEGSPGRAVQLAAAVTTLCETAGLPLPPPVLTGEYRAAAAASGEPPDELWAAGLSLTSRDAVCLAVEPPAKAPVGSQPARP